MTVATPRFYTHAGTADNRIEGGSPSKEAAANPDFFRRSSGSQSPSGCALMSHNISGDLALGGVSQLLLGGLLMTKSSDASSTISGAIVTNLGEVRAGKLEAMQDLASQLLQPNPEALNTIAEQIAVPVVSKLDPNMFFRTHPELRLTLKLVSPGRESLENFEYAVLPAAEPLLLRHKLAPYIATLYPIVVNTQPLTYRLMRVKHPANGRRWDNWNLTRKAALDRAVEDWIALRSIPGGGYEWVMPHPEALFPEPIFPAWDANEWLVRSLGVQDLILGGDENHPVFKSLSGL
jgi:hypothetical protein